MDEITNLYTKVNGKYACNKCNHQSNRYDNLKRHIAEMHLNKKVKCEECGKELTKSALSRHKRLACKNVRKSKSSNQPDITTNSTMQPDSVVSVEQRTIAMNLEIVKLLNGKVIIKSDDIEIDGLLFQLKQKEGKMVYQALVERDEHLKF